MRTIGLILAVLAAGLAASARSATPTQRQVLFFDATITQSGTAGPRGNKVGHLDSASGIVRDAAGHRVGRFFSTCVLTKILGKNLALERCSGSGVTGDGRLEYAGTFRTDQLIQIGPITGGTGAFRGARGTIATRGISEHESLVTVTVTPRPRVSLRAGVIAYPAANAGFRTHADVLCGAASRRLDALPPFPFSTFDPLHPDPKLLPKVGAFLTGPHDSRPILRTLNKGLRRLASPPARPGLWVSFLAARDAVLAAQEAQDRAALAGNVDAFIASIHDGDGASRRGAIAATIFGVKSCVL